MAKKMLIDATHAEETRVVVVDGTKVEEFDFESVNKRQLAGNIYLAKVTRVEPSLQAAFVDYGGNRHGFLAFSEIHPDYYQIPVADRKALLEEERAYARAADDEGRGEGRGGSGSRKGQGGGRSRSSASGRPAQAEDGGARDAVRQGDIPGMDVVDFDHDEGDSTLMPPPGAAPEAPAPVTTGDAAAGHDESARDRGAETDHHDDTHHDDTRHDDNGDDHAYAAVDHASELDSEIESVADEDVSEEIRAPRRPRARRYKIQEVVKVRQIMLVQVVKEERGNKGAALTTYLSLPGRYCVLMPNTARGGGISRKITNAPDRKKLKEIAGELEVPEGAGLIIRTAGAQRTKTEIKRDYEYLMRLWEQIRDLTLKSIAPAPIYEEGNLIKRAIRDLYSREIDEVLVEGEAGYRIAKDFMKMIMPSHARNVKLHNEGLPLFARYGVESYLAAMFNPVVQLKSGGYIVIGVTEALVAIDVNSGRATKEGSIEETALKTNLEAAEEVARQLRLRDLAGLIVIDFIDMEERKNNAAVEKRLKEKLKTDRARIQVGRISGFGLLEMSRQRLRPGMIEATTQPCPHCHGTGLIRSDDSLGLAVLRQLEEEGTRRRAREVLLRAPVAVTNFLMNYKREHILAIEARYGMAVRLEADPTLVSPDFHIERFKTATRVVPEVPHAVISVDTSGPIEDDLADEDEDDSVDEAGSGDGANGSGEGGKGKKRRRRRRRRGGGGSGGYRDDQGDDDWADSDDAQGEGADDEGAPAKVAAAEAPADESPAVAEAADAAADDAGAAPGKKPAAKSGSSRSRTGTGAKSAPRSGARSGVKSARAKAGDGDAATPPEAAADDAAPAGKATTRSPSTRTRAPRGGKKAAEAQPEAAPTPPEAAPEPAAPEPAAPEPTAPEVPAPATPAAPEPVAPEPAANAPSAPEAPAPAPAERESALATAETPAAEPAEDDDTAQASGPRKRGWWSLRR